MKNQKPLDMLSERQPLVAFVTLSILYSIAIVVFGEGRPPTHPMDQGFVFVDLRIYREAGHWIFQYPKLDWAGGITGSLLVGVYKLLVPTQVDALNHHVKILVTVLYFGSTWLVAKSFLDESLHQVLALLIVASAGLHILEPSTETIAACYLNFFIVGVKRDWPVAVQSIWLGLFALVKAELVVISLPIALLWIWIAKRGRREHCEFLLVYCTVIIILMAPSWYLHNTDLNRALGAFEFAYCQRYAFDELSCVDGHLNPAIGNLQNLILSQPKNFLLFLSKTFIDQAVPNIAKIFGVLLVVFPALFFRGRTRILEQSDRMLIATAMLGFIACFLVGIAVGHVYVRYFTRVYVFVVVATLLCLEKMYFVHEQRRFQLDATVISVAAVVIGQNLWWLPSYWNAPHEF